jgi:hypothetical protein
VRLAAETAVAESRARLAALESEVRVKEATMRAVLEAGRHDEEVAGQRATAVAALRRANRKGKQAR